MNKNAILLIPGLALVAACGGSNNTASTTSSPPINGDVLETFADGSGIARFRIRDGSETYVSHVMGRNIGDVVAALEALTEEDLEEDSEVVLTQDQAIASVNAEYGPNSAVKTDDGYGSYVNFDIEAAGGVVTTEGEYFFDKTGQAYTLYLYINQVGAYEAGGAVMSGKPSGEFVYTGRNYFGKTDDTTVDMGSFSMNVDFDDGSGTLNGTTGTQAHTSSSIAGDIVVDIADGTFTGENLTLKYSEMGGARIDAVVGVDANLFGNFHGEDAAAVSGLYTDDSSDPKYFGMIAGSRPQEN